MTIEVIHSHDASTNASWIWVDAFQVSGSATTGSPAISGGGIVSAASFMTAPNNQVAPGQIVSIFDRTSLLRSASASKMPLPTQLGPQNTTVTACGRALPLYSVFPGQINAQILLECPASGVVAATVSRRQFAGQRRQAGESWRTSGDLCHRAWRDQSFVCERNGRQSNEHYSAPGECGDRREERNGHASVRKTGASTVSQIA